MLFLSKVVVIVAWTLPLWLLTDVLLGFYVAFERKGVEPSVDLPEESLTVLADQTALARVVRNLVANALSYTTGGVRVRLAPVGERVCLEVANRAEGTDPATVPLMFERFYRADRARTGAHAGLGLSLVAELVRQMSGSLGAELVGQGASAELVIRVELPRP